MSSLETPLCRHVHYSHLSTQKEKKKSLSKFSSPDLVFRATLTLSHLHCCQCEPGSAVCLLWRVTLPASPLIFPFLSYSCCRRPSGAALRSDSGFCCLGGGTPSPTFQSLTLFYSCIHGPDTLLDHHPNLPQSLHCHLALRHSISFVFYSLGSLRLLCRSSLSSSSSIFFSFLI